MSAGEGLSMAKYLSVEEARKKLGLRIVVAPAMPGPWSEAIKGICFVKKLPYALASFEVGGENAALKQWSAQASSVHVGSERAGENLAEYLTPKYGYSAEKAEAVPGRIATILHALANLLQAQRQRQNHYFMGSRLTALDIYWAAFAALIDPLPNDLCPITEETRGLYRNPNSTVQAAVNPILIEHRDFIYKEHLELPIDM